VSCCANIASDILVDDNLILELKAVDRLAPVFDAQLRGYMRAAKKKVGRW
jgi:GxxExxY protein